MTSRIVTIVVRPDGHGVLLVVERADGEKVHLHLAGAAIDGLRDGLEHAVEGRFVMLKLADSEGRLHMVTIQEVEHVEDLPS